MLLKDACAENPPLLMNGGGLGVQTLGVAEEKLSVEEKIGGGRWWEERGGCLDTEWLPNLNPGENHPIAILQLSIGNRCLIFQLLHADFIPVSLHAFLADPRHTFCGVGIKDDVDKLYDHHKLRVRKIADLNDLARLATINSQCGNGGYKYMGLKKMAYAVLGKKMEKPLNVTLSKWDAVELDRDQIEYAAIDAVVSYQLGYTLCSPIYRPQPGSVVVGRPGLLLV
ncbi:PREDICTED: exonuclease 3'-5' domain-containing protein 2-like [Erythranthe guttata]|uniref:exonuclease 3'-5' domain-containing protein 2-like n=1 Tax=Erythranthe guttata TaxID=4155 RepID=UPI00064DA8E2|nr:PREDICTED: exonuclease 3'-5' domain-containing protein 2-like [Erythranthe guttata]|eukprot:XP_012854469.1 PREDICTED: exonuclease 3'-5' domain-containing protein 2-like [Erythranthe guttata]